MDFKFTVRIKSLISYLLLHVCQSAVSTYLYQLVRVIMMYREARQRWKWKKE